MNASLSTRRVLPPAMLASVGAVGLCLLFWLGLAPGVSAQEEGMAPVGAIDARVFEVLSAAQQDAEAERYAEALARLDGLESDALNSYARSQLWNFRGYIHASQGRYQAAITAYRKVLAETDAPQALKQAAQYTLAQLYFQTEAYAQVIAQLQEWLAEVAQPATMAYIMLTQAYFETGRHADALRSLDQAIRIERAAGRPVKEDWLRMKVAIHFQRDDLPEVLAAYRELMRHYPRISYLRQIAGLHGELGGELQQLAFFDAVYQHGALDSERDLLNLAYMYLGREVPYKAGRIIEQGMAQGRIVATPRNIDILASAWVQANEYKKAIPVLENAARDAGDGRLYARLAGVHFNAGDYARAAQAARRAQQKGGLEQADSNRILLGTALFNIEKYEAALQVFRQAKRSDRHFADARKWERHTLNAIRHRQLLEQSELPMQEQAAPGSAAVQAGDSRGQASPE